ncbi:hypothetical protein DSL72_009016 [Monilinia vaccinii-corymbosi]|uniref:Uncharacterized protein n=1 Tax=Monilinia vaccinii-corymbosi TaxID=61207 RepID=A0A8A3PQ38_9HELO|nr:hypothetical protein DSL72_009016 [Monilinia vaccinii-corymbosi]
MSSKTSPMAGGPIISISDMDNFMRIGELAQCARSHRPIKKTSSMDFDLLRASGNAARRRRRSTAFQGSTCASPSHTPTASNFQSTRSTPCPSPSLRPLEPRKSRCDLLVPVEITTPWKLTTSHPAWGV